jgi:hypothetical protein
MSRLARDDQKTLWEIIAAVLVLVAFLVLAALILWPLGKLILAFHFVKGFALFWVILSLTWWLLCLGQRIARIESDPPSTTYICTNLGLGAFLQAGWSAFAALTVLGVLAGSSHGSALGLHVIGFLSSLVASVMTGAFYQWTLYKLVNGPLALLSYIVFAFVPALAGALYGWFFRFF